jgi:lysophospholipase L1-like esterase
MPLRESPVDRATREINLNVSALNQQLTALCQQSAAQFVNVNPAMADNTGGLKADLTADGLHLNPAGYQRLAVTIAAHLPPPASLP